jgi:hypothetical protein
MSSETGKWIILLGVLIVIAGVIIYFFHDKLQWLGRLPGDIRLEKDNFRLFFPVTSMILLSVLVSLLIYFFRKFFN